MAQYKYKYFVSYAFYGNGSEGFGNCGILTNKEESDDGFYEEVRDLAQKACGKGKVVVLFFKKYEGWKPKPPIRGGGKNDSIEPTSTVSRNH